MKKQTILTLFALMVVGIFSISASAQTHSVWTNDNGLVIRDAETGCKYGSANLAAFDMATSWSEASPIYSAIAHFRGVSKAYGYSFLCPTDHFYEFTLIKTGGTNNDEIKGSWDVYRDGVLKCNACDGIAYGLSQAAGGANYYKVYVDDPLYPGTENWLYSGYLDVRKDF